MNKYYFLINNILSFKMLSCKWNYLSKFGSLGFSWLLQCLRLPLILRVWENLLFINFLESHSIRVCLFSLLNNDHAALEKAHREKKANCLFIYFLSRNMKVLMGRKVHQESSDHPPRMLLLHTHLPCSTGRRHCVAHPSGVKSCDSCHWESCIHINNLEFYCVLCFLVSTSYKFIYSLSYLYLWSALG